MKTRNRSLAGGPALLLAFCVLAGCSKAQLPEHTASLETPSAEAVSEMVTETEAVSELLSETQQVKTKPQEIIMDWSEHFENLNGAAVIYEPSKNSYQIYNREQAFTRRSPCSTFKIVSSLAALENGIIGPGDSKRVWSGETFWNEKWNRDIAFQDAFQASCVWYFRELTDEIGKDRMQAELDKLQYGNCDISDWEGHLNTNNNNPALTGFWIESSLKISPVEQTQVMERIFGEHSEYREDTKRQLMEAMAVVEVKETNLFIYGKTGMGKQQGIVVDSWFTGFADVEDDRIYFCVYLGETDGGEVSSAKAKEIALDLIMRFGNAI